MRAGKRQGGKARVAAGVLALMLLAACSKPPAPPPPVPEAPPPEPQPVLTLLAPRSTAGTYRLRTAIERRGRRGPANSTLLLYTSVARARPMGAPDTAYNAAVSIPGYTRAPRGRSTTPAAWWPLPGDSLVVQVGVQQGDIVQLRGRLEGRTIGGELWYLSSQTGNSLQLGTFSATKR